MIYTSGVISLAIFFQLSMLAPGILRAGNLLHPAPGAIESWDTDPVSSANVGAELEPDTVTPREARTLTFIPAVLGLGLSSAPLDFFFPKLGKSKSGSFGNEIFGRSSFKGRAEAMRDTAHRTAPVAAGAPTASAIAHVWHGGCEYDFIATKIV